LGIGATVGGLEEFVRGRFLGVIVYRGVVGWMVIKLDGDGFSPWRSHAWADLQKENFM
jgi:hypothetical protein